MEESTDLKGISITESIKLFLKINIFLILFSFLFNLLFVVPLRALGTYFIGTSMDAITQYINE